MEEIRKNFVQEIQRVQNELKTAGPIHKRDLLKHLYRMKKELDIYDRYQKQACIARERATIAQREALCNGG